MTTYIWQHSTWPYFQWNADEIVVPLAQARKKQGAIAAQAKDFGLQEQAALYVEEILTSAAIEGEAIDPDSIRSSVARRLGLSTAGLPTPRQGVDGFVAALMEATRNFTEALTADRLFSWHAGLFPTGYSGTNKITVAQWRQGSLPMQVISGSMGKERVHYEAPPANRVAQEMKRFLAWWNKKNPDEDGLIQAAIAHLWFVTVHPFEDGNGRLARVITDMTLARDERTSKRLYSLSAQILENRKAYYAVLEATQKGKGDITEWIKWFLTTFERSLDRSQTHIDKAVFIGEFHKRHADTDLNERQWKVIRKLLEHLPADFEGGLTNRKYVSITGTTSESSKRDIKDLVEKSILLRNEKGGRSTSYRLNRELPPFSR